MRCVKRVLEVESETPLEKLYQLMLFRGSVPLNSRTGALVGIYFTVYRTKENVAFAISSSVYSWRSVRRGSPRTPNTMMVSPEFMTTFGGTEGTFTTMSWRVFSAVRVPTCLGLQHDEYPPAR